LGFALESTWQNVQAFFVDFMYSGLPYEVVVQTRKPPANMSAGNATFKWNMMPPVRKLAIPAPSA
jgi:hypothetical protein